MMDEMSLEDWRYWQVMNSLEPLGRSRQDYAIAQLTEVVYSMFGGKVSAEDWLPKWEWKESEPKTGDEMAREMRQRISRITSAKGRKVPPSSRQS